MQVPDDDDHEAADIEQARQVLRSLRSVTLAMQIYADGVGHDLGLHRSDLMAMNLVSQAAGRGSSMTPSQVAKNMSLSAAAVTALVDRLERVGHLVRQPDPDDGRRVRLGVSRQAEDVSRDLFQPMNDELVEAMDRYTEGELELISRMLDDLTAAVHRARGHDPVKTEVGGDSAPVPPAPTLGDHATG